MKPLFLIVGKSASGKTSLAKRIEKEYGMKQIQSYTTRPPRYENEVGHTFISHDEFNRLTDIIAYTEYDGNKYCCTKSQLDESDIYIIDPVGVEFLMNNYASSRDIHVLFFSADIQIRMARMRARGNSEDFILQRIENDNEYDWWDMINKIASQHESFSVHKINANLSKDEVFEIIADIILTLQ